MDPGLVTPEIHLTPKKAGERKITRAKNELKNIYTYTTKKKKRRIKCIYNIPFRFPLGVHLTPKMAYERGEEARKRTIKRIYDLRGASLSHEFATKVINARWFPFACTRPKYRYETAALRRQHYHKALICQAPEAVYESGASVSGEIEETTARDGIEEEELYTVASTQKDREREG